MEVEYILERLLTLIFALFKILGIYPISRKMVLIFVIYNGFLLIFISNVYIKSVKDRKISAQLYKTKISLFYLLFVRIVPIVFLNMTYFFNIINIYKHLSFNEKLRLFMAGNINSLITKKRQFYIFLIRYFLYTSLISFFYHWAFMFRHVTYSKDTNVIKQLLYFIPNFILSLIFDYYYACLSFGSFLINLLNERLQICFNEIQMIVSKGGVKSNQSYAMQKYCNLSDKIDHIASVYLKIYDLLSNFHNIWDHHLLVYLGYRIILLVMEPFLLFMILKSKHNFEEKLILLFVTMQPCIAIILTFSKIIICCSLLQNEVKKMSIFHQLDNFARAT